MRMKLALAGVAAMVLAGACSSAETVTTTIADEETTTTKAVQRNITGDIRVPVRLTFDTRTAGNECSGTEGYDNIHGGARVVVLDGQGAVVGVGGLTQGEVEVDSSLRLCRFTFTVPVEEASFYTIEVADRGGPTYSVDELEATGWKVSLSLG